MPRDLYEALALPCSDDAAACEKLVELFSFQQRFNREPLPPVAAAVLQTLYTALHQPLAHTTIYPISELTGRVNNDLAEGGERFRLSARAVGAALLSLGITTRKRTNTGWTVWLDPKMQEQIHKLVATYGLDN
jgi:hypothetical protein